MEESGVIPSLLAFIDRLDGRRGLVDASIREWEVELVRSESGGLSEGDVERLWSRLDEAVRERAKLMEAMRWGWRVHDFLQGARAAVPPPHLPAPSDLPARAPASASGPTSKGARARELIAGALRADGPLHRRRLLELLLADGVLGTEARPMKRLAKILSQNRHLFGSDGRGTYSLLTAGHTRQRPGASHAVALPEGRPIPSRPKEKEANGHAAA